MVLCKVLSVLNYVLVFVSGLWMVLYYVKWLNGLKLLMIQCKVVEWLIVIIFISVLGCYLLTR